MCIEFLHCEVVNYLNYNSLFTLNLKDRTITLYEDGLIDEESTELSKKQIFNKEILYSYQISPLIRNKYLESKIKEITGNDIKIIDHPDSEITGISCVSCRYIVYENFDESIFEICPVCYWQTDTLDEHGYSRLNKAYLSTYKNTSSCKEKIKQFQDIYVRK